MMKPQVSHTFYDVAKDITPSVVVMQCFNHRSFCCSAPFAEGYHINCLSKEAPCVHLRHAWLDMRPRAQTRRACLVYQH